MTQTPGSGEGVSGEMPFDPERFIQDVLDTVRKLLDDFARNPPSPMQPQPLSEEMMALCLILQRQEQLIVQMQNVVPFWLA